MVKSRHCNLTCPEIYALLKSAAVCRLCVSDDGQPYAVPMRYTFEEKNGCYTFTLLSASQGMKLRCMRKNAKVCLQVDQPAGEGTLSVVALGRATLHESGRDIQIHVYSREITGRLYYNAPERAPDA